MKKLITALNIHDSLKTLLKWKMNIILPLQLAVIRAFLRKPIVKDEDNFVFGFTRHSKARGPESS